jgi:hypothetical protein
MNTYGKFYTESLYPIQDGVLSVVKSLHTPLHLTGGTALSRHYLHHRYSDDLDLFVIDDPAFMDYSEAVIGALEGNAASIGIRLLHDTFVKAKAYVQLNVAAQSDPGVVLKIDLVNDVAAHFGGYEDNPVLGKVDGWQNILANKLSALFRFEAKDYVDIWALSRRYDFHWDEMISAARNKEAGLDSAHASEVIRTVPEEKLRSIKWVAEPDYAAMRRDLERIAWDILEGGANRCGKR